MANYGTHEFNKSFKTFCKVFETKILQLKTPKNILLWAYWPLSDALLSSEVANQEEDKICFSFFIAIIRTLSVPRS